MQQINLIIDLTLLERLVLLACRSLEECGLKETISLKLRRANDVIIIGSFLLTEFKLPK